MKKKIVISFMIMALVMSLAGGATFAWFTDQDDNSKNFFASGNLNVDFEPVVGFPDDRRASMTNVTGFNFILNNAVNFAPGSKATGTVTVRNVGTLPAQMKLVPKTEGPIWCTNPSATEPQGMVVKLVDNDWYTVPALTGSKTFNFEVEFLKDSDNTYMNAIGSQAMYGNLNFNVYAVQADNISVTERDDLNLETDFEFVAP